MPKKITTIKYKVLSFNGENFKADEEEFDPEVEIGLL